MILAAQVKASLWLRTERDRSSSKEARATAFYFRKNQPAAWQAKKSPGNVFRGEM
jgi:hypothetical protein